jgi:hypothetical protein
MIPYLFLILSLAYFAFNIWFVSPAGNFPINDDFIYADAVQRFAQQGDFALQRSLAACFLHVAMGGTVCKLFGFSHVALRVYTLVFALLGIVSIYLICREVGAKRSLAGLLTCCYAANPLLLNLSFSFMTDIPALTLNSLFLLSVLKAARGRTQWYWWASLFLCAAVAIRQTSVLLGFSTLVLLFIPHTRKKHGLLIVSSLVVLPLCACFAEEQLMQLAGNTSPERVSFYREFVATMFGVVTNPMVGAGALLQKFAEQMLYIGLFLSPVLLAGLLAFTFSLRRLRLLVLPLVASVILIVPGIVQYLWSGTYLPFTYNLWNIPTLGLDRIIHVPAHNLPADVRAYLTLAGSGLGVLLVSFVVLPAWSSTRKVIRNSGDAWRRPLQHDDGTMVLIALSALIVCSGFLAFNLLLRDLDRYYLLLLAPSIMCLAITLRSVPMEKYLLASLPVLLLLGASSSIAQQESMNYQRARWQALDYLERSGIKATEIDGGIEYNFTHGGPTPPFDGAVPKEYKGAEPQCRIRWWPIHGEKYIVSLCSLPGYYCIGVVPYWESLKFKQSAILILKQNEKHRTESARIGYAR